MAKQAIPAAKVAKSQRTGPKLESRVPVCTRGHKQVTVLTVGYGLEWRCECDGYQPIDLSAKYQSLKADGIPGKAREASRGGAAYLQQK